jgi:hypothetical protein
VVTKVLEEMHLLVVLEQRERQDNLDKEVCLATPVKV